MTIEKVFSYVTEILCPEYDSDSDHKYIFDYLLRLCRSDEIFSQRLLICIGIDLKTYRAEFTDLIAVNYIIENYRKVILDIKNIDIPETYIGIKIEPHIEFALALGKFGFDNCRPAIQGRTKATYVRVTNFDNYFDYILPKNKRLNPDITFDIEKRQNWDRFYQEFTEFEEHRDVNLSALSSGTGWVFTTDKSELEDEIQRQDIFSILDKIGYYAGDLPTDNKRNKYIYIEYPTDFAEEMLQPTALIGDWGRKNATGGLVQGNEFFLSYKKENEWGKTFSVSGLTDGIKERAHFRFEKPHKIYYQFKADDLNELTKQINKASGSAIINEALLRFKSA